MLFSYLNTSLLYSLIHTIGIITVGVVLENVPVHTVVQFLIQGHSQLVVLTNKEIHEPSVIARLPRSLIQLYRIHFLRHSLHEFHESSGVA